MHNNIPMTFNEYLRKRKNEDEERNIFERETREREDVRKKEDEEKRKKEKRRVLEKQGDTLRYNLVMLFILSILPNVWKPLPVRSA